jgi:diacylglycerol kinase family enzyme
VISVLVNPKAGGRTGPGLCDEIAAAFAAAGSDVSLIELKPGDDVIERAREAAMSSEVVVAGGGDGTVNAVATALAGTDTALGVLPAGTLNHFARDAKLPSEIDQAAATVVAGRTVTVDVAEVNGRVFVNNSSIGVYPNAVAIREQLRREGRRKWIAMGIAIWRVLRTYRGVTVDLEVNGKKFSARTPFVFVGNNEYVIEGRQIGAREHLTSGQIFVYLAPAIATRRLPLLLLRALFGHARETHAFETIPTSELKIDSMHRRPIAVSLDGETTTLKMPLHYRSRPAALKVIT